MQEILIEFFRHLERERGQFFTGHKHVGAFRIPHRVASFLIELAASRLVFPHREVQCQL